MGIGSKRRSHPLETKKGGRGGSICVNQAPNTLGAPGSNIVLKRDRRRKWKRREIPTLGNGFKGEEKGYTRFIFEK